MKMNIKKLESKLIKGKDIVVEIGEVEEDYWDEEDKGQSKPGITTLRHWDHKLLKRYKPFYSPTCDMCCLCTFGKCELSHTRGACGIDMASQQARMALTYIAMGTAAHAAHARHMLEHVMSVKGKNHRIDLGLEVDVEAPITRTVVGIKPRTLADLEKALDYAEEQITHVLAATAMGQESNYIDFESKALHLGMIDNLVKEIADIAQIVGYDLPKGDENTELAEYGFGNVDIEKPVVLVIGHNAVAGFEILEYIERKNLIDEVEVTGICCSAHDLVRKNARAKIVGPFVEQLRYVKSGVADVIVVDEQCVRTDIVDIAKELKSIVIAVSDKACHGLRDRTKDDIESIINDLSSYKEHAVYIGDPSKAGVVAVEVARRIYLARMQFKKVPDKIEIVKEAEKCTNCHACMRVCPVNLDIPSAMKKAKKGDFQELMLLRETCVGCGRCNYACPKNIDIVNLIEKANEKVIKEMKSKIRAGRGPIKDTEIRNVGAPIVFGEIPGVVAFAGCTNYYNGIKEVGEIAEEFLKRNYIVVVSGCAAMSIANYKTSDGMSLYEKYPGVFDAGGLVNVGSCVANAHIIGAAIKIANIFARRPLRGNFEEIADYILNRVGAVAVVWGTYSQKALAIGTGANRWGIPVILGPNGVRYRRLYLGRKDKPEDWEIYDARTGKKVLAEPAPEHLAYVAQSKEEAMVLIAKLVMRPNDTTKGRQIKLTHYIDLHKKFFGKMPDDIHLYIRTEADIPFSYKDEVMNILKEKGWKPKEIPDPTLSKKFVRKKVM